MKKLIGGAVVIALASLGWAGPQTSSTPASQNDQTAKHAGKKSAKHKKQHSNKKTPASETQK